MAPPWERTTLSWEERPCNWDRLLPPVAASALLKPDSICSIGSIALKVDAALHGQPQKVFPIHPRGILCSTLLPRSAQRYRLLKPFLMWELSPRLPVGHFRMPKAIAKQWPLNVLRCSVCVCSIASLTSQAALTLQGEGGLQAPHLGVRLREQQISSRTISTISKSGQAFSSAE
mmetsp:Transcript_24130/g.53492  ORF Transcript_24130/g.53492 Transcript_24130/m.53492 type:complete len:174 (-) Transcript_24130:750-1271(-)